MRASVVVVCALAALSGCEQPAGGGGDPGAADWVDYQLTAGDHIYWPGVDQAAGRVVQLVNGFGNGGPAGYWFVGLSGRETDDMFVTCRDGDEACPLTADGRIAWDHVVGKPLFSRVPGDPRYSPWWQLWTVRVDDAYEPDSVRTIGELFRAVGLGTARVDAELLGDGRAAIAHLPLVLRGTELAGNGETMPDGSGPKLPIERLVGWRQGLLVEAFDFTQSEGVFGAAADSESRPRMPFANIYTFFRACDAPGDAGVCSVRAATADPRRSLSEQGLGQDFTGDGDRDDTNTVLGALPGPAVDAEEPSYSPLWAVSEVVVPSGSTLELVDDYRDQRRSDVTSAAEIRAAVARGELLEPVPARLPPDTESTVFFDCPVPIAAR